MKNSKISDRQLAKQLKVSQPTVTRRRAGLEKKRLLDYTAIPDFKELGYEIMAFSFVQYSLNVRTELRQQTELAEKIQETMRKHPNIIYASSGTGLGMHGISVSIHENYSDYVNFRREMEDEWGAFVSKIDGFVVSLKGDNIIRNLTLKFLSDFIKAHET
jgi:DNA-binding Lrp family transcriptional regulator